MLGGKEMELLVPVPSLADGYTKLEEGIVNEDECPTYRLQHSFFRRVRCGEPAPAKHAFQVPPLSSFRSLISLGPDTGEGEKVVDEYGEGGGPGPEGGGLGMARKQA